NVTLLREVEEQMREMGYGEELEAVSFQKKPENLLNDWNLYTKNSVLNIFVDLTNRRLW
ncbi:MAG: hypothetical protein EZS28_042660, partial [Streblomastix strix]